MIPYKTSVKKDKVTAQNLKEKNHDKSNSTWEFQEGNTVLAKNIFAEPKWLCRKVKIQIVPLSYLIQLDWGGGSSYVKKNG